MTLVNPIDVLFALPRRPRKHTPKRKQIHVRYFRGRRCNQDWMQYETDEAKRLRGAGWIGFCRLIRQERGTNCQRCGIDEGIRQQDKLHVHHVLKVRTHRHLRFERENVLLLCQQCHKKHEFISEIVGGIYRDVVYSNDYPSDSNSGQRADDLGRNRVVRVVTPVTGAKPAPQYGPRNKWEVRPHGHRP